LSSAALVLATLNRKFPQLKLRPSTIIYSR
jgi:hypothetical protein